jgi:hypothetical protein
MNYKKILNILIIISLLLVIKGIILINAQQIGLCAADPEGWDCRHFLANSIGQPLFLGFSALGLTFLLLRFLPIQVLKAWLYFAAWYVPLAAAWIIITPTQGGHFLAPDKEGLVFLLGGIYLAVSVLIVLIRAISLKFSQKRIQEQQTQNK